MKRMKIVGLCLVAAFAFAALAGASTASAAKYNVCVAKKKGKYADSACTTLDEKKGKPKGNFEKEAPDSCYEVKKGKYSDAGCSVLDEKKGKPKGSHEIAPSPTYTDSTGPATLETPAFGPNNVTCTSSASAGQILSATTANDRATFTGCELEGFPCESIGPESTPSGSAGTIITNELDTTLIDVGPAVDSKIVAAGEHGAFSSEFACVGGLVKLRTQGYLSGEYTPGSVGVSSLNSTVLFEGPNTEQFLGTEVNSPETSFTWVGPAPSNENIPGGAKNVDSSPVEIEK
jgi:hypothetical protein